MVFLWFTAGYRPLSWIQQTKSEVHGFIGPQPVRTWGFQWLVHDDLYTSTLNYNYITIYKVVP